jgi:hypothetical protein
MNVHKAAEQTLLHLGSHDTASQNPDGVGSDHAIWMLRGITLGYIQHEKAHRWLGYAQAIVVATSVLTLAEVKDINKRSGQ